MNELTKRKWCYVGAPMMFDYPPCSCGDIEHQVWSEYEKHVWCPICQKDYVPDHHGILSTPIPLGVANMLGITFDTIDLDTMTIHSVRHLNYRVLGTTI